MAVINRLPKLPGSLGVATGEVGKANTVYGAVGSLGSTAQAKPKNTYNQFYDWAKNNGVSLDFGSQQAFGPDKVVYSYNGKNDVLDLLPFADNSGWQQASSSILAGLGPTQQQPKPVQTLQAAPVQPIVQPPQINTQAKMDVIGKAQFDANVAALEKQKAASLSNPPIAQPPVQVPQLAPAQPPVQVPKYTPAQASVQTPQPLPIQAQTQAPVQAPTQPLPVQAPVQAATNQSPQIDIQAKMKELEKVQQEAAIAGLEKQKAGALSNLSAEQAKIQPMAYDDRNKANISMNNANKAWNDFLASKGLNSSGVAGQGFINTQNKYQGEVGSINRDATNKEADILRRTTDVNNNYLSDVEASRAGITAQGLQNYIAQLNTDRDFNRLVNRDTVSDLRYDDETKYNRGRDSVSDARYTDETGYNRGRDAVNDTRYADETGYNRGRDAVGDTRYNTEYADSRNDVAYSRNYQTGRDSVADTRYTSETSYNQGRDVITDTGYTVDANGNKIQTVAGKQAEANMANINSNTEYQKLVNAGYPAEQAAKMSQSAATLTGTNLNNDYQKLINAGYNAQDAADLAQKAATTKGIEIDNQIKAVNAQYAEQIKKGEVDQIELSNSYQVMLNENYSAEQAAKIAGIIASNKGIVLDNAAKAIANVYEADIKKSLIDGQKLQNAYQKLVNKGYSTTQAADLAAKYAAIRQGDKQNAISQQNATTNASQAAWDKDPTNPKNMKDVKTDTATTNTIDDYAAYINSMYVQKGDLYTKPITYHTEIKAYLESLQTQGVPDPILKQLAARYGLIVN